MNEKFSTEITSEKRWFDINLAELIRYKDLIFLFVQRTFTAYYKQTILGPLWAIIQPLFTTVVFTLVFGKMAGLSAEGVPFFAFYFSGTMLWTYFSQCLSETSNTFIANSGIMGKVYFPRLVMPISTVISKLIMLGIQFMFFVLFEVYYIVTDQGIHCNIYVLLTPLLVLQLAFLGLGFGIIVSALTTKYRDLGMLVGFGTQLWMYATPVAYDIGSFSGFAIGGKWHTLYMLNPITPIINVFRYGFLGTGIIEWDFYGISWLLTLLILFVGIALFNRVEKTFADTV